MPALRDLWQADAEDRKRIVDALAEGYAMVRKRLQRAMAKEGLYRMASVGLPVDPHAMTVVEVVDGEAMPRARWLKKSAPAIAGTTKSFALRKSARPAI